MNGEKLYIRVDASSEMGTGHVMRCLALAQAWVDEGGAVVFVSKYMPSALASRIQSEGMGLILLPEAVSEEAIAAEYKGLGSSLAIDFPHYSRSVLEAYANPGLLVIDDKGIDFDFECAVILNQNLYAREISYHPSLRLKLLRGLDYALIRREFLQAKESPFVRYDLLLTFGGADPLGATAHVIRLLNTLPLPAIDIAVLVGSANQALPEIEDLISDSEHSLCLLRPQDDMASLLSQTRLCLSSGGSTIHELMFKGIPALVGGVSAYESKLIQYLQHVSFPSLRAVGMWKELSAQDLSLYLDDFLHQSRLDPEHRLIDGKGASRMISFLMEARDS